MYSIYTNYSKGTATVYAGSDRIILKGEAARFVNAVVTVVAVLSVLIAIDKALG